MRHRKDTLKMERSRSHRAALLSNLVTSLIKHERIRTTDTKARAAMRVAERVISFAKRGDLAARREAFKVVKDKTVLKKLFDVIAPRMKDKTSGFISVTKLWPRHGDAALMGLMELYGAPEKVKPVEGEKKATPTKKAKAEAKKEKSEKKEEKAKKAEKPAKAAVDKPADKSEKKEKK